MRNLLKPSWFPFSFCSLDHPFTNLSPHQFPAPTPSSSLCYPISITPSSSPSHPTTKKHPPPGRCFALLALLASALLTHRSHERRTSRTFHTGSPIRTRTSHTSLIITRDPHVHLTLPAHATARKFSYCTRFSYCTHISYCPHTLPHTHFHTTPTIIPASVPG